ncbi:fimbrillin family protein [Bacteroides sp. 519]|uniref:fimbrillin family protein n=1 Tax=Bacteroides sp. 519 TaxID=2302937 RepID=UPI0013CF5D2F|nr:fimbrillin family protein [Bacteroides sp. 519]NDV58330.1 hypothetical protein [Bacteroides sp. 519]
MMKQIYTIIPMLTIMLLVSCSKTDGPEIDPVEEEVPVRLLVEEIGGYDETSTRKQTPHTSPTLAAGTSVHLFTYTVKNGTIAPQMNNVKGTVGASSNITYSGNYYWPFSSTNSIHAYAFCPYTAGVTFAQSTTASSIELQNYSVGNATPDLLYARNTSPVYRADVPLEFNHALSRVGLNCQVINNTGNITTGITITSVSFNNVNTKGNLTVPASSNPQWTSTTTGTTTYTGGTDYTARTGINAAQASIFTNDNNDAFLLMPITNVVNVRLTVKIRMATAQGNKELVYSNIQLPTTSVNAWKMGQYYVYNMIFDAQKLLLKVDTVTLAAWGSTSVTIPPIIVKP